MNNHRINTALLTGANGMLGKDFHKVLKEKCFNVIPTDISNLDITDENEVKDFFDKSHFDIVIHCAAYTDVEKAEEELDKAMLINVTGTEYLARYSSIKHIPIVYISTDYVFDGTKQGVYKPDDRVCPLNNYGLTKSKGEEIIKLINPEHIIVRTSWLYGIYGKNFVETIISIAKEKEEIKIVSDQKGCPTWTVDLAEAVVKLISGNNPYGVYHICGSGHTTWFGFAKKIVEYLNLDTIITPVSSEDIILLAKRPKNSVMENYNSCPDWEDSLKMYLKSRGK